MIKILEPKNGGWFTLTNLHEDEQRVFSKKLINPKEEDWVEWTEEEKTEFENNNDNEEESNNKLE